MINTVNALTFRQKFGEIIDGVVKTGLPVIVERQNRPLVVLYPFKEKKGELEELENKKRKEEALKLLLAWRKKWGSKIYPGEKTTTQMIREMRDNRYGKRWWKTRTNY